MMAPRLNRQLALEERGFVADGAGGFTESWTVLGLLWAEVNPRTGRDAAGEGAKVSTTSYRIVVRGAPVGHTTRPLPGQRLREGPRVYRIDAVTEADPTARYLVCFAEEELAA
ncbi:head-tail adaptor protein [Mesobacterium pallidum]|uniref:head-tail adaptor protein n=1 Tax=Mesobacterium pallidum TaxID=2872037 RepID=UPI001EE22DFC|nr:head-tail adaptor protein [Mesobacterium pallidum]